MVEAMEITETSFKSSHACTAALSAPTLKQAPADPHLSRRLLDTHGQVWVSLLWGHSSFLLDTGAHTLLHSMPPSLLQPIPDPHLCCRLLDTHGQVWVSLLWGQYFFLPGLGAYSVLYVPSKSLFPSPV